MTARGRAAGVWFLAALILLVAGCGGEEDVTGDAAYEVDLPAGWSEGGEDQKQLVGEAGQSAVEDELGQLEFEVTSVWMKETDTSVAPTVSVLVEPLPADFELEAFVTASRAGLQAVAPGIVMTEPQDADVGGEPARSYESEAPGAGPALRNRTVNVLRDDGGYSITFTDGTETFDANVGDFEEILASWDWT